MMGLPWGFKMSLMPRSFGGGPISQRVDLFLQLAGVVSPKHHNIGRDAFLTILWQQSGMSRSDSHTLPE